MRANYICNISHGIQVVRDRLRVVLGQKVFLLNADDLRPLRFAITLRLNNFLVARSQHVQQGFDAMPQRAPVQHHSKFRAPAHNRTNHRSRDELHAMSVVVGGLFIAFFHVLEK